MRLCYYLSVVGMKGSGVTGFDVGCEPSVAYRGAVSSQILLQNIVANSDYAKLAA